MKKKEERSALLYPSSSHSPHFSPPFRRARALKSTTLSHFEITIGQRGASTLTRSSAFHHHRRCVARKRRVGK